MSIACYIHSDIQLCLLTPGLLLSFSPSCVTGRVTGGGHVTYFQTMAGFCLPSLLQQAQSTNSSIHLQTHHASAALCSLITPKLPRCTLNNCFLYTNLFQSPTMSFILCIKTSSYLIFFPCIWTEPPMITALWQLYVSLPRLISYSSLVI